MAMALSDLKAQALECLRYLAGNCDGANSRDGHGFNKFDSQRGHELASYEQLPPARYMEAVRMLQKYRKQLEAAGLRAPAAPALAMQNDEPFEYDWLDSTEQKADAAPLSPIIPETTNDAKPTTQPLASGEVALSTEQQAVFQMMETTKQHLFITGRAGTGKSVLLRHFRNNTKKSVVVAAPTGIAALNVKGQTLHSLFRLAPGFFRKGSLAPNARVCTVLKRIDTLVIDEISMVRADLLDAIDERLREAHKNTLPFGGVQVIMFGDVYQLPPVVEDGLMQYFEHTYGGHFFFHADVWKQAEFKIYELSQVFRQKDPTFKNILNTVRDGTVVDEQLALLNKRCGVFVPTEGTITLATTNNLVTNINQRKLDQLPGKSIEYRAQIIGEMKRGTFPTEEIIQLKVGAQVVLLQNDKNKRWVNGTVATIAKLKKDENGEGITVRIDGIDYPLEKTTWEEIKYEYDSVAGKVKEEVVSSFTQYPVRLAWAMTIHKSQGQTYESVALDLTVSTFAPGQLYVALSRATSMEGLYLKMPVRRKDIIVEPRVTEFMSRREAITIVEDAQDIQAEASAVIEQAQAVAEELGDCAESVSIIKQAQEIAGLLLEGVETTIPLTTPHPQENVKTLPLPKQSEVKRGRGKKSDLVKVAYKFSPEVVEKLNKLAEANPELNKSAFIDGVLAQWFEEHGL